MQKGQEYFFKASDADKWAFYEAACLLADRYRAERDAARRESSTTKARLGDTVSAPTIIADEIAKALSRKPGGGGTFTPNLDRMAADIEKAKKTPAERSADIAKSLWPERVTRPGSN
jgi:hypothetical protein